MKKILSKLKNPLPKKVKKQKILKVKSSKGSKSFHRAEIDKFNSKLSMIFGEINR